MSKPISQQAIHAAAKPFEPRLARAFLKATERMRSMVNIYDLAHALAAKDAKRALAIVRAVGFKEALAPVGSIAKDAFMRGGRVGADVVNRVRRAA